MSMQKKSYETNIVVKFLPDRPGCNVEIKVLNLQRCLFLYFKQRRETVNYGTKKENLQVQDIYYLASTTAHSRSQSVG